MAQFETEINVRVGLTRVCIDLRIWRDREGNALVGLEARDRKSQEFLTRERSAINEKIAEKYGLKQTYVYEHDEDGYYVPQEGSKKVANGIPLANYELAEIGRQIEQGQHLSQENGLPPCPEMS